MGLPRFLKSHRCLLVILGIVILFRLPSFFEPYWYGDEAIYLAIGQALRRGAVLYRDIWDNKTPLLYLIYAISPALLWAKVSAALCVLGTAIFSYKITKNHWVALATGLLLSFPPIEGHIANAELYFTLPIIAAAYIVIARTPTYVGGTKQSLLIGLLFTIAFLIKVPAIFDFLGLFLAYFIIAKKIKPFFIISFAPFLSLIFLTVYFFANHALSDFLVAAFAQNYSYVAIDSGPLSKLTNPLFVKAFLLLLALIVLLALFIKKKISRELFIVLTWFGFSLYGALLSNRDYPHYLLQIVPPLVLSSYYLLQEKKYWSILVGIFVITCFATRMFWPKLYPFTGYYVNLYDYLSERETLTEYYNYFDGNTSNNYAIAQYLNTNSDPSVPIFVWGDNAAIYVLSDRPAATKFIQAHHLTTIDPKNYNLIIQRLDKYQPKFIIISQPIRFAFPALELFVKKNYRLAKIFNDWYVYQNIVPANPPKFDIHY